MPVPTTIDQLSTTSASNYPAGSDSPSTLDDVQRAHGSFIAIVRDLVGLGTGAYVKATAVTNMGLAPVASPTFTGTVTAPTFSGALSGNATTSSSCSGNANSATNATNATNLTGAGTISASTTGGGSLSVNYANSAGSAPAAGGTSAACSGNSATATALSTAAGSAPSYGARAWCTFDGTTGTLISSGNVSSVTRTAIGQYTVNFTTAMQDTGYAILGTAKRVSGNTGGQVVESELSSRSTSNVPILTLNQGGSVIDPSIVSVVIFR